MGNLIPVYCKETRSEVLGKLTSQLSLLPTKLYGIFVVPFDANGDITSKGSFPIQEMHVLQPHYYLE